MPRTPAQPHIPPALTDLIRTQAGVVARWQCLALGMPGHAITYRVRIGVNAREGENYNSASVGGKFPSGESLQTPPARAAVRVSAGVFSMRQIIIGRVFVDSNGNQMFDRYPFTSQTKNDMTMTRLSAAVGFILFVLWQPAPAAQPAPRVRGAHTRATGGAAPEPRRSS